MGRTKPLFIFYLLVGYVFMQFCWWTYHIFELNQEIYHLKSEILILGNEMMSDKQLELDEIVNKKFWMVIGEGSVFLFLLILGFYKIRSSFKREILFNRQQKNFLLSITHELKSPLASTKLHLETLQKHDIAKEKEQQIISTAINETERLSKLVDNILIAAKIDSSVYSFHKEKVNLSELVSGIISKADILAEKHHQINADIKSEIHCLADELAITSILLNLIDNALKYSPKGSAIHISLKKDNDSIILSVKDEGIGIANSEKQHIFKKFYRVGNEETRETKGTGLGLFIVKYLVENHNAQIIVKDNLPNGAIFEVHFKNGS